MDFEQYRRIIMREAHKFSRYVDFAVPYEDLYSVGCLSYVECLDKYDEKRGKFITFLVRCVRNEMHDFINEWKAQLPLYYIHNSNREMEEVLLPDIPEAWLEEDWESKIAEASEDCQKAIQAILDMDIESDFLNLYSIRKEIRDHLMDLGWNRRKVYDIFRQIKNMISM